MGCTFLGVLHLPALPGSPGSVLTIDQICQLAIQDARSLAQGGADGAIMENFGDTPFCRASVPAITIAAMTAVGCAVRRAVPTLPLGINVLRNDAVAALSIAKAVGGCFVRVNVHAGAMVTDQGIVQGDARTTLLLRQQLFGQQKVPWIAADVAVKHAAPLADYRLEDLAKDTALRGLADALIVTGAGTGQPTSADDLARVKAVTAGPVWIGSGLTPTTVPDGLEGAIVGTYLHRDGQLDAPLDTNRIQQMRQALGPSQPLPCAIPS